MIDDSPTITKVVQLVLTKAGYQVQTAADGEQGLVSVRSQRPELILLDFVMPRMNGYQFCRELTADAKLRDIPVILMSAKGDPDPAEGCMGWVSPTRSRRRDRGVRVQATRRRRRGSQGKLGRLVG